MGAIAKTKKNEIAEYEEFDYSEYAADQQYIDASDLSIPFIRVLQSNSPAVVENSPEGARAGMIYNTVTQSLIDSKVGMVFQPCHREHKYTEWVPRDSGGGFVGIHETTSDIVRKAQAMNGSNYGKLKTMTGNDLVETFYLYGNVLDDDGEKEVAFGVIGFASTAIKPYKKMMTGIAMAKGVLPIPLYAWRVRLFTELQKNEKGSFYNFKPEPLGGGDNYKKTLIHPKHPLMGAGKRMYESVVAGERTAAYDQQDAPASSGGGGGGDEQVPF